MQGRDPDHDEGAPGRGPSPDPERRGPDRDDHGSFPVPENPYGASEREGERSPGRPAGEEPSSDDAPTEAFQQVSRDRQGDEPGASQAAQDQNHPGDAGEAQDDIRDSKARPGQQSAQSNDDEAATEAFGAVSPQQGPPEQQGPHAPGGSGEAPTTGLPQTGPPSDSLRLAIGDPASRQFPTVGRDQPSAPQPPYHHPSPPPAHASPGPPYGSGAPHGQEGRGIPPGAMSTPGAAGHSYPGQSYDFSDIYAKPRPRRGLLVASLVVAALLVVGGGAFAYASFVRDGAEPGGAPVAGSSTASDAGRSAGERSAAPTSSPSPSFDPARIRSAQTDPRPLRLAEAFPEKTITVGGRTFERVATDMTRKCGETGRKRFAEALRKADCQRVLRATFVDARKKYAVTVGVAVLPAKADAAKVDKAANASKNVWFAALPGPKRSGAAQIHRSGGYSALEVVGHYAVFAFAAYANKITPPPNATDLSELCAAMRDYATQPIVARGMVTPSPAAG